PNSDQRSSRARTCRRRQEWCAKSRPGDPTGGRQETPQTGGVPAARLLLEADLVRRRAPLPRKGTAPCAAVRPGRAQEKAAVLVADQRSREGHFGDLRRKECVRNQGSDLLLPAAILEQYLPGDLL